MDQPIRYWILVEAFSLLGGAVAAWVMSKSMELLSREKRHAVDIPQFIGQVFKRDAASARSFGWRIHLSIGIVFGALFGFIIGIIHLATFPEAVFVGLALGLFLAIFNVFSLMYLIREKLSGDDRSETTIQIGLSYFIGHLVFGAITGFFISIAGWF